MHSLLELTFVIRDRRRVLTVTSACVRASEPGPYHLISGVSCLCRHCFTFTGEFCTPGVMTGQSCYIPVHSIHVELYIFSEIWNYSFYRQHYNYLYSCLYSLKRMYARVASSSLLGLLYPSTFLLESVIYTTRRYQSLTVMTDDSKISPLIF